MVLWRYPDLSLDTAQQEAGVRRMERGSAARRPMGRRNVQGERERHAAMTQHKTVLHGLRLERNTGIRAVLALVCLLCLVGSAASAQSASTWNKRGQAAEVREDYDAAFEAYRQAHLKAPKDLRYRERFERLRFTAANLHVDRGRVLRQSGDVTGAINEFARALQIDPGNEAAAQELQITERPPAASVTPGKVGAVQNSVPPGQTLIPGVDEQMPRERAIQQEISSLAAP